MPQPSPQTRRLALLRAINLGGHNRVPMADLRTVATELGYADVSTYIASGNLLFTSEDAPAQVADALSDALATRFGFGIDVVVLTPDDLEGAQSGNPFLDGDPKMVHVGFCNVDVAPETLARIRALAGPGERFAAHGKLLFLDFGSGGVANSKAAARLTTLLRPGFTTARNMLTVRKLGTLLTGSPTDG